MKEKITAVLREAAGVCLDIHKDSLSGGYFKPQLILKASEVGKKLLELSKEIDEPYSQDKK